MIFDFIIPFISILLAEFGDKTQIAVLSLSSKSKNYFQIFFGVMFAFIIIDGFSIYFAKQISQLIPIFWIKIISGIIFILLGIIGLIFNEGGDNEKKLNNNENRNRKPTFFISFFIILFAEFGDKSQIAAGVFATIYNPILVFIGVILSLSILTISAIYLGRILIEKFNKHIIEKFANIIFILIGISSIFLVII